MFWKFSTTHCIYSLSFPSYLLHPTPLFFLPQFLLLPLLHQSFLIFLSLFPFISSNSFLIIPNILHWISCCPTHIASLLYTYPMSRMCRAGVEWPGVKWNYSRVEGSWQQKWGNNLGLSSCAVPRSAVACVVVYFRRTELLSGVQERSGI